MSDQEVQNKQPQATVCEPVTGDKIVGKKEGDPKADIVLTMPSTNYSGYRAFDDNEQVAKAIADTENSGSTDTPFYKWVTTLSRGVEMTPYNDAFTGSLSAEGAKFSNMNMFNGKKMYPQSRDMKFGSELRPKDATTFMNIVMGTGNTWCVPLYHSGFWVTFRAPTDIELVELKILFANWKTDIGRNTYGLVFSNTSVVSASVFFNYAKKFVFETTVRMERDKPVDLGDLVRVQDLYAFLLGFACTWNTSGFNFARACVSKPTECTNVIEEKLNLTKMLFSNLSPLTDQQRAHMSNRQPNSSTIESVKRYQSELTSIAPRSVDIASDDSPKKIVINLHSPSCNEHFEMGNKWIDEIVSSVEKAIIENATSTERQNYMAMKILASVAMKYAHWVKDITVEDRVVESVTDVEPKSTIAIDRESINSMLVAFSGNDELRDKFSKSVEEYIEMSTISVVGIPEFDCPVCEQPQTNPGEKAFPRLMNIIPVDVLNLFMILTTRRLEQVKNRSV